MSLTFIYPFIVPKAPYAVLKDKLMEWINEMKTRLCVRYRLPDEVITIMTRR